MACQSLISKLPEGFMIRLEDLSKSFGDRTLFTQVDWQTNPGQCIGLVGPNGVGKSTLLHLIVGEDEPDGGKIHIPKHVEIGYLPQEVTVASEEPLLSFILQGARRLLEMESRLLELEEAMASATDKQIAHINTEYAELSDRFRQMNGYAVRSQVREIASGLGFKAEDFDARLSSFSGGWRMRALIGRLLLSRPEVLLLDEPTNHLDMETIEWLENFLRNYEGTIILISHDRYFLNRLVNQIAELTPRGVRLYPGNYDTFLERRDEERLRLENLAEHQQKEIARLESFIERFRYKATKSRQVQSRIKQLDKLERVETMQVQQSALDEFRFPQPERLPKIVIELRGVSKAYGDHIIYQDIDFQVCRGDKLAFVGPNGSGKSTLLKMLADVTPLDAGERMLPPKLRVAYFAQHSVEQLDLSRTLLEEMQSAATLESSGKVRDILGVFGFSGDIAVNRKIHVLSGGEKTRLALAKLMLEPAACLLLDEPTNHLDMESRQILEYALRDYEGAVCIVSHDRYFLNQVVNQVIHVEHGRLESFEGDYDYYHWKMLERAEAEREQSADARPQTTELVSSHSKRDLRRALADLRKERTSATGHLKKEVARVEQAIADTEAAIAAHESTLADPATLADPDLLATTSKAYQVAQDELMALMEQWEEATLMFEEADAEFAEREAKLRGE